MNIPKEAITAFQQAWETKRKEIGRGIAPAGTKTKAGLTAALPHIRAQIAAEIRAESEAANWAKTFRNGLEHAAQTVEEGTTK